VHVAQNCLAADDALPGSPLLSPTGAGDVGGDYGDCLNSWIGQGLSNDCAHLGLHFTDLFSAAGPSASVVVGGGTALRFCPLETAAGLLANTFCILELFSFQHHT
jgi:hypothetical protein